MQKTNSLAKIRTRLQSSGDTLAAESQEFEDAILTILSSGGQLTNKTLILLVIRDLEQECDPQRQAVLRSVLELIVSHTPDDAEQAS